MHSVGARLTVIVGAAALVAASGFLMPVLVEATSAQEALAPGAVIIYEWHTTKAELLGSIDRAAQVR